MRRGRRRPMTSPTRGSGNSLAALAGPPCPDCGWSPSGGGLWPSEGGLAVAWIQDNLIQAKGDVGRPILLRADQKLFLYRWYEHCGGCGRWRFDEAVKGAATGDGKTTLVAAVAMLEAFGPPQVRPVDPDVVIAAASWDQAHILFGMAGTMAGGPDGEVAEAPLRGLFEVYEEKIVRRDRQPGQVQ